MKCFSRLALLSILLTIANMVPARAQETPAWTFSVTPYAWLMGTTGNLTAKGQTVDVNAGIVDMFGKTDTLVALMSNFEARRGKLQFGLDFIYTQMVATPGFATQRNPLPFLNFSAAAGANVKSTLIVVEGTAGYEIARLQEATAIDGLVGVRYWHAMTDIDFGFTATTSIGSPEAAGLSRSGGFAVASTGSMDWADPIVGLRLRHELAPHHHLRLRGDVGGFGVGSQFTWQTFGGYSYEFSSGPTSWAAVLGYRALGVNYAAGSGLDSRAINLVMHGPVLGLTIKF